MDCKVRRCFCCVPVHHAALMIGAIHAFRLFTNIFLGEFFFAASEMFTALAFLAMVWRDSKQTRFVFFVAFCSYVLVINSVELYQRKYPSESEAASRQAHFEAWCQEREPDDDDEGRLACESEVEARMLRDELVFIGV